MGCPLFVKFRPTKGPHTFKLRLAAPHLRFSARVNGTVGSEYGGGNNMFVLSLVVTLNTSNAKFNRFLTCVYY